MIARANARLRLSRGAATNPSLSFGRDNASPNLPEFVSPPKAKFKLRSNAFEWRACPAVTLPELLRERGQRGRPDESDATITLHLLDQADPADCLGIKPLRRQKHQRKIGRARRVDVLLTDIFRATFQLRFQIFIASSNRVDIALFLRRHQPVIISRSEILHQSATKPARRSHRPAT